jgi:hypothetical protein
MMGDSRPNFLQKSRIASGFSAAPGLVLCRACFNLTAQCKME